MSSFLSDARARIQHTNKLSLAPKDLKNLADIISTEKNVLCSSSKLSVDYRKSAEALKEWGLSEGDDLADILPKLSILLGHLADAQSRFSDHDGTYRIHFKSIRMREESLTALKKSKEAVQTKISGLEKKITKMSSENKDLPALTTRLQEARSELISLENSVAIEEARLSDFKRETVREGISLRLGAMLELAEKMTIVCEFGKMLTTEVPMERTAPGAGRAPYCAAQRTQAVVEEAQRCLTQVVFNPTPSSGNFNPDTSFEGLSSQSPPSDTLHPTTPHQAQNTTGVSESLAKELPPLYFSESAAENPIQTSQAVESRNNGYGSNRNQAGHTPLDSYSSLPYLPESESLSHSNANAHSPHDIDSRPPLHPSHSSAKLASRMVSRPSNVSTERERPSYLDNVFHVRGMNGVPHPTEPIVSPSSLYSPPASASLSEGLSRSNRYSSPSMQNSPQLHASSLAPPDLLGRPLSGSGGSETAETGSITRYSPRPRDPPISSGVSSIPPSEGRTTNAGAFRRPHAGSQPRPLGSTQASDEALTTGPSTAVQPLQINKRDSVANYN